MLINKEMHYIEIQRNLRFVLLIDALRSFICQYKQPLVATIERFDARFKIPAE